MVYTAPIVINGTPYDASLWQAALDEIARLSASARVTSAAYKTTAETVNNSAAFQNDDVLFLAMAANKRYRFEASVLYTSPAAPDFKFQFTFPAGATARFTLLAIPAGGTINAFWRDQNSGGVLEGTGSPAVAYMVGTWVTAGAAGNLQLQWAQNTATAVNTQVLDGSFMSLTEI